MARSSGVVSFLVVETRKPNGRESGRERTWILSNHAVDVDPCRASASLPLMRAASAHHLLSRDFPSSHH